MDLKFFIDNAKNIVTQKFFCFDGRADRKEFWCWVLTVVIINAIFGWIPGIGKYLSGIFSLIILLPYLGVTARRLHDCNKTGWLLLLHLIPLLGGLIVLLLCIPKGDEESNKYGEPVVR